MAPCRHCLQLQTLKEKVMGVEAASKRSPAKVQLAGAPANPAEQRRSLFRSNSEDGKLESDLEAGTIPAL